VLDVKQNGSAFCPRPPSIGRVLLLVLVFPRLLQCSHSSSRSPCASTAPPICTSDLHRLCRSADQRSRCRWAASL
jgi:hypothetical protein